MPEAPKDIVKGVPISIKVWRGGHMVDIFDPKAATGYRNVVAYLNNKVLTQGLDAIRWLIGLTVDDTDYLFGPKNRRDAPLAAHPHIGFLNACTAFDYGTGYLDSKLYSKYAWEDMLRAKYSTIQALNAAWGSNYTAFDDNCGFGVGTGLLDEDCRHVAWLGNDRYGLSNAKLAVKSDMDAFVYEYAYRYATIAIAAIRIYDKHHLIFGPMAFSSGGYMNRPQVLQALADVGVDAFPMDASASGDMTGHRKAYDLTGKPVDLWYGVSANADSALHGSVLNQGIADLPTQSARAQQDASDLDTFYNAKSSNADNYLLGIDFWELTDGNINEETNRGLIMRNDNAYDGKEAVRSAGTDRWGFPTGGEDQDYGDFLSAVRSTNFEIQEHLTRDLTPFAQRPAKSQK